MLTLAKTMTAQQKEWTEGQVSTQTWAGEDMAHGSHRELLVVGFWEGLEPSALSLTLPVLQRIHPSKTAFQDNQPW